jgi:CIC family chloride channel protein
LGKVVETDFSTLHPDDTLGRLVRVVSNSKRNIFPVVDTTGDLLGVVLLDDIRQIMFSPELYDSTFVRELMTLPPDFVVIDESMESVMRKFEATQAWNLPVIDGGKYVGFVSKSKIFSAYRSVLVQFSEE